jgi:hypothetical protein
VLDAAALAAHTVVPPFRPRTADYWTASGNGFQFLGQDLCLKNEKGVVIWGSYADLELAISVIAGALWSMLGLGFVSDLMKERFQKRITSRLETRRP